MKQVELYAKVRHAVRIEGLSERGAARRFGIDPRTVSKMLKFSVPPGYRRSKPPVRPKLDPFIGVIDRILTDDKSRPKKQQHTAKVMDDPGEVTLAVNLILADRKVHGKGRAILAPACHFPADADNLALAGVAVLADIAVVLAPVRLGHEYLDILPNQLCSRVAEQLFRGWVYALDEAHLINRDDGIDGRLQYARELVQGSLRRRSVEPVRAHEDEAQTPGTSRD